MIIYEGEDIDGFLPKAITKVLKAPVKVVTGTVKTIGVGTKGAATRFARTTSAITLTGGLCAVPSLAKSAPCKQIGKISHSVGMGIVDTFYGLPPGTTALGFSLADSVGKNPKKVKAKLKAAGIPPQVISAVNAANSAGLPWYERLTLWVRSIFGG